MHMPRKSNYPDWVLKHKKPGTYINKVGDKYYLYAAHSERVEGKKYPVRVCDGYLGRITEEDGFTPVKSRIQDIPQAFEIGLSYTFLSLSGLILNALKRSYRKYGTLILCCSILSYIHGLHSRELFLNSYLHIRFPDIEYPDVFSRSQLVGIERGIRMLEDSIPEQLGDDMGEMLAYFPDIRLLRINGEYYLTPLTAKASELSEKHGIDWRDKLWQK